MDRKHGQEYSITYPCALTINKNDCSREELLMDYQVQNINLKVFKLKLI